MREELAIIQLELKYCERCGALWLRPRGEENVYCALCLWQLSEISAESGEGNIAHLSRKARIAVEGRDGEFLLVCDEGGNA